MNDGLRKCSWCQMMVDPELCFADPILECGWVCSLCGKQVMVRDVSEAGEPHNPSPPSDPQE